MLFRIALLCALLCWLSVPATAQVMLNELLADPATDWDGDGKVQSRDDEWVEILNAGTTPVDLTGYRLAGADTSWRYEFAGTLGPGGLRIVFGSESYAWEQATGNPSYGLRLANSGGEIHLWKLSESDTTWVDGYVYQDHEADDDRSSGRMPDGDPVWGLFDGLNLYGGTASPTGSGCMPSPGETVSCATPVRRTTWGAIKQGRY